jgi:REP-associated tyrosine transposase
VPYVGPIFSSGDAATASRLLISDGAMSRPKRLPTFDYCGPFAYSLTLCAFERTKHFESEAIVGLVTTEILRTAAGCQFAVLAYCFMPDHLHLLVQGTDEEAILLPFIKLARQRASHASRRSRAGILWQDGYFERTLRHDEDLTSVAAYIAHNPVRAELIERAEDWPFSGGTILDAMWGRTKAQRRN